MVNISYELGKMIESSGRSQEFYSGLTQFGKAAMIAIESLVRRIILNEKKINKLEEESGSLKQEIKDLKTQYNCLEKRFQEKEFY